MQNLDNVISQWHQLIENFDTSALDFYKSLEAAIERRQVPDREAFRMEYKEGGVLSAKREYLRIIRGKHSFDICAAPFGTGYFFSWWLTVLPTHWFVYLLCLTFGIGLIEAFFYQGGLEVAIVCTILILPLVLGVAGWFVRSDGGSVEDGILAIPFLGNLYARIFDPPTYYKMDSAIMFQEAIHNAVLEVIDGLTTAKGIRMLSEAERKPINKAFASAA